MSTALLPNTLSDDLPKEVFIEPASGLFLLLRKALLSQYKRLLFVRPSCFSLEQSLSLLKAFVPPCQIHYLPAQDEHLYDYLPSSPEYLSKTYATHAILQHSPPQDTPHLLVVEPYHIGEYIPPLPPPLFLKKGFSLSLRKLTQALKERGYQSKGVVTTPGQYSIRGSILDLFPPHQSPVRLDFFDTQLESLHTFCPNTQRRKEAITSLTIPSVMPFSFSQSQDFCHHYRQVFGLKNTDNTLYHALSEGAQPLEALSHWPLFYGATAGAGLQPLYDSWKPDFCLMEANTEASIHTFFKNYQDAFDHHKDKTPPFLPPSYFYAPPERWFQHIPTCLYHTLPVRKKIPSYSFLPTPEFATARSTGTLQNTLNTLAQKKPITIFCAHSSHQKTLHRLLTQKGRPPAIISSLQDPPPPLALLPSSPLPQSLNLRSSLLLSSQDILGIPPPSAATTSSKPSLSLIEAAQTFHQGDYLVHASHGLGQYRGLKPLTIEGREVDCLELAYRDNDRLYVPVQNMDLLYRYSTKESRVSLDKLGSYHFLAKKTKLKKRLLEMASALIKTEAQRLTCQSASCNVSLEESKTFASLCPYPLTTDQKTAIDTILQDLQKPYPMDRLLCADTGFGKTEVALQAAFSVAISGGCVAFLTPTTLLCQQHYNLFVQRLKPFPLHLQKLSRFETPKEQKKTKEDLAKGHLDILISTHSLLSIPCLKRLNLLIIDEEHRFGLEQKEALKGLKKGLNVLSLSATPLPRTLKMAMEGLRELSFLNTPPPKRQFVRTILAREGSPLLEEALNREALRGGQIFYICPKIRHIPSQLTFIKTAAPSLKVKSLHGKMPSQTIETTMEQFQQRKIHALVCTSIVEAGIDIPNMNTVIIHSSHLFGLAQLYQLRGRAGRGDKKGYCYIILPNHPLGKTALARLEALQSAQGLGSSFQLANYDMDIRGAGNLLGTEQWGHIKSIGIQFYQYLLEQALKKMTHNKNLPASPQHNNTIPEELSPTLSLGDLSIPESYIQDIQTRLHLYRSLSMANTQQDLSDIRASMIDRFGPLGQKEERTLHMTSLRIHCKKAAVSHLTQLKNGPIEIIFSHDHLINPKQVLTFIHNHSHLSLINQHKVHYKHSNPLETIGSLLKELGKIQAPQHPP